MKLSISPSLAFLPNTKFRKEFAEKFPYLLELIRKIFSFALISSSKVRNRFEYEIADFFRQNFACVFLGFHDPESRLFWIANPPCGVNPYRGFESLPVRQMMRPCKQLQGLFWFVCSYAVNGP